MFLKNMARSESYNTKQKDLILNVIKNQKHEFTIKDIYEELNEKVGLTTIYRLVDKLIDEKVLNKNISRDNTTYYQYLKYHVNRSGHPIPSSFLNKPLLI